MRLRDIPLGIKLLASIFLFPFFLFVWVIACSMDMSKVMKRAEQNPNEETVQDLIDTCNRIKLAPTNHPQVWAKYRNLWYKINGSNRVPTYLKQQVIDKFTHYGLYANTKVIDNYKSYSKQ